MKQKMMIEWIRNLFCREDKQQFHRFQLYRIDYETLLENKEASIEFGKMLHNAIISCINSKDYTGVEKIESFMAEFKELYSKTYNEELSFAGQPKIEE